MYDYTILHIYIYIRVYCIYIDLYCSLIMWNGLIHVSIKFMATKPIALELVECSIARLHDTNMFTDVSFLYHLCAAYGEPILRYCRHVCVSGIVLNFFHFTIGKT